MKKVLFYSVAFAAALTSCTKEEVFMDVTAGNETQDLSIRPKLGEIVLTDGIDVVTRFAASETGAQAQFAKDDKLGAAIMDAPLYTSKTQYDADLKTNKNDASKLYDIVPYYSSNSAFTYDGSAWWLNNDMPLVEGNYLFYAPYNAQMQLRSEMTVLVPTKQDASAEKSALNAYYKPENKNVVKVGHQFLAYNNGEAQKPSLTLHDVMAYPVFTIKNNFKGYLVGADVPLQAPNTAVTTFDGGEIVVKTVELINNTGADLAVGGQLDNDKIVEVVNGAWKTSPFENYTADVLGATQTTVADGKTITTLNVNRTVAKDGDIKIYAVMPAVQFDNGELTAKVTVTIAGKDYVVSTANVTRATTIDGEIETVSFTAAVTSQVNGYKTATGTVTLNKGQKYPQEELNFDGKTLSPKTKIAGNALTLNLAGGLFEGTVDATENDIQVLKEVYVKPADEPEVTPTTNYIDDNAEFIAYFKELENGTALVETPSLDAFNAATSVTPEFRFSDKHKVVINSELIDALSLYNNKGSLTITSALEVTDDVTVAYNNETSNMTFTSVNGKTYEIVFTGGKYTVDENYFESQGKSIHVIKAWTAAANATTGNVIVYKNATATVNAAIEFTATSFVNNGTLNANGIFAKPVTNNGVINVVSTTFLTVDEKGTGIVNLDAANLPTLATNLVVTKGQTGVYNVTSIPNSKPYSWVTTLNLDMAAIEFVKPADLNGLKLYSIVNLTSATAINFNHGSEAATFDMGATTTYTMKNNVALSGVSQALTTVNNFNMSIDENKTVTMKKMTATGKTSGKGKLAVDASVTEAAKWN